jgi:ribonucleoside-triphosphate reductase (thioredoxin)
MSDQFNLSQRFVDSYRNTKPPFGFNGLGEFVYMRTYSRVKANGTNETWCDTIERVVNGTMRLIQTKQSKRTAIASQEVGRRHV